MGVDERRVFVAGSVMVAIAVEHCDLHKRIALRVLLLIGTSKKWFSFFSYDLAGITLSCYLKNALPSGLFSVKTLLKKPHKEI